MASDRMEDERKNENDRNSKLFYEFLKFLI